MTGEELKTIQSRYGWSNKQLADLVNGALDRKYDGSKMSQWRNDRAAIPTDVAAFLAGLDETPPPTEDLTDFGIIEHPEDTAPGGGSIPDRKPLALASSGIYARTCEEFFELISTAVGMIGGALGNQAIMQDGLIIYGDKAELGKAWGKLAENNETFRRLLMATDKQGAYLAVALATGTTVGKIWRNHATQPPGPENLHGYATPEPTGPTLVTDAAAS